MSCRCGRSHRPTHAYSARAATRPSRPTRTGKPGFLDALAEILEGARRMLTPHGVLVLTARAYRHHGQLVDLPGQLIAIAKDVGLVLQARHAALLCGLREERLVPRVSFFQLRWQRTGQVPRMQLVAHEDVIVLAPARSHRARTRAVTPERCGAGIAATRSRC